MELKAASKREQSQACLSFAEREQAQAMLKVLMNHIYELNKAGGASVWMPSGSSLLVH